MICKFWLLLKQCDVKHNVLMCEIQLHIFNRFSFENTTVSCCNLSINQIQMESLTNIKSFVLTKCGIESSKHEILFL